MWITDMNGTLVNMDNISCLGVPGFADVWVVRAYESSGRDKRPSWYDLGKFDTKKEEEQEFAKIKAKLMRQVWRKLIPPHFE